MSEVKIEPGGICPLFSYHLYLSRTPHNLSLNEYNIILDEKQNTELNYDNNLISNNKYILNKLPKLKSYIEDEMHNYFYNVMEYGETQKIYITNSWSNYNKPGTKTHMHKHPNSLVSGVYYIVDGDAPPIEFHSNDSKYLFSLNVKRGNLYNSNRVWFNPINHHLFLFPSTLMHEVAVNKSNATRISIAFNTFIKGPTGSDQGHSRVQI